MFKHISTRWLLTLVAIVLTGIFAVGCNSSDPTTGDSATNPLDPPPPATIETDPPADPTTPSAATQSVNMTLYFPNADASGLIAAKRSVPVENQEVLKAMFSELGKPPTGSSNPLPAGTVLLGASVDAKGVATIDLSSAFRANFIGGSAEEQMTMYSIVNSLTTLSNVNSVQFLMEGEKYPALLGKLDTLTPLEAKANLISAE